MAAEQAVTATAESLVYFTLVSSDNQEVKISALALQQSKTLGDLAANLQLSGDGNGAMESIPIENITKVTLEKLVEWCEHYKGEPFSTSESVRNVPTSKWEDNFFMIPNDELFNLIVASDFLDCKHLMLHAVKKVGSMAEGKTPEELRVIYGIPTVEENEAEEAGPPAGTGAGSNENAAENAN